MDRLSYTADDNDRAKVLGGIRVHRGFDTSSERASAHRSRSESELIPQGHGRDWYSTGEGRWGTLTVDVESAHDHRREWI